MKPDADLGGFGKPAQLAPVSRDFRSSLWPSDEGMKSAIRKMLEALDLAKARRNWSGAKDRPMVICLQGGRAW
jgi:hypothetical protein